MAIIDIPWHPSTRQLRQFGWIFLPAFCVLVAWWLFRAGFGDGVVAAPLVLAALVAVLTLVAPRAVRAIFVGWMVVAFPIGWVVSHVMLAVIFYGAFTIVGGLMRLCRYDPMRRRKDPAASTYFTPVTRTTDPARYFRQF